MEFRDVILDIEKLDVVQFLKTFNLDLEKDVTHTINCFDGDKLIGTISCSDNIIKCMAIDSSYQGESIANKLVSKMIEYIYSSGEKNIFVFTKPSNITIFSSMGFKEIITTTNTTFLEMHSSIEKELMLLKVKYNLNEEYAAIVVNCNPMTNGHLYLIERCALENENVIVFVVEEDRSFFKFKDRFRIVETECKRFENVTVVPSTKYMISSATFPSYFLKDDVDVDAESMELDLKIFVKYFMPILNIKVRYVGTEPFNILTRNYNQAMKDILPNLVEIERMKFNGLSVSATKVRECIANGRVEELKMLVPQTSYDLICNINN